MDKNAWYFEQPVSEDEMNFEGDSIEAAIRNVVKEGQYPFGIVSGYTVAPSAGLAIAVTGAESVAYDKLGHRIKPILTTITQSVAAATDGGTTAVSGGGNERWVSVFARYGRKWSDAATDGDGHSVRKTVTDVLNALGEGTHGSTAYDATAAKEAGIDKFYVAVGAENGIGLASRPSLIDDGVLIADVRLVQGQSAITTNDIYKDRRQELPSFDRERRSRYEELVGGLYRTGVLHESYVSGTVDGLFVNVNNGRGWVYSDINGHQAYDLNNIIQRVAVDPPVANRHDHIIVDPERYIRVLKGSISIGGTLHPPAAPAGSVVLAEIRAIAGTSDTSTWPIANRRTRLAPYPLSRSSGVLEGCRLAWGSWPVGVVQPADNAMCWIKSKKNKVLINGEVTEFDGGPNVSLGVGYQKSVTTPDQNADPFASAADGYGRPYFIYFCRNVIASNVPDASPVLILESTTPPDEYSGQPTAALRSSWNVTQPADALCIGMGWVRANFTHRAFVSASDDGWFYPQFNTGTMAAPAGGGNVAIPNVPDNGLIDQVKLMVSVVPSQTNLQQHHFGRFGATNLPTNHHLAINQLPHTTMVAGVAQTNELEGLGEYVVPALNGKFSTYSYCPTSPLTASAEMSLRMVGAHLALPRATFGAG
jgi:hypothetical protein